MKKLFVCVLALCAVVVIAAAAAVVFIDINGWQYSIREFPIIGKVLIRESGMYCTPNRCAHFVLYTDSENNPDPDNYWANDRNGYWVRYY